jgi:hypothetical protein
MAGDWIPIRLNLHEDPAVFLMAERLSIHPFEVVGRLLRVWGWANSNLTDGHARSVTPVRLDCVAGVTGFAEAMADAGWLVIEAAGLTFPKFEVWNSQSAKRRILATKRKRQERFDRPHSVPPGSRSRRDRSVTREEKRRVREDASASSCPEPAEPASGQLATIDPPVMTFPVVGTDGREWPLTAAKLAEYRASFPGVDVPAELRKARQWCLDNLAKRKTWGGMPKFLGSWLGRAQDRVGGRGGGGFKTKGEQQGAYFGQVLLNSQEGGHVVGPKDF